MNIIINTSSMIPIYEQIVEAIKKKIASGELQENEALPSVRTLSGKLKISALTVKKAYDRLEEEGFTATIHGKGSYVRSINPGLLKEERLKELEAELSRIVEKAKLYDVSAQEVQEMLALLYDPENEGGL
ncbi:MAG: GntR family transcriptional regulator [Lachnospiraceae bacterium]|nr:GntR family transcriptional regulator [Lachnospiraceae bacterium]